MTHFVTHALESDGYAVVAASDGAQALRMFPQEKFDLVVLDIMMPKASGYDVCRELRARGAHVPVLRTHRYTAIETATVIEVSTPELDDVVRIQDDFGREGTSAP